MKLLIAGLSLFIVITLGISAYLTSDDLRNCGETPDQTSTCQKADVIVAVSGGDTSARTAKAIELYKAGWAPQIIFSGAAKDKTGPSNATAMMIQAVAEGVPSEAITIEEQSETTRENAIDTAELIKDEGAKRVILVTSAYHARRAGLEFTKSLGNAATIISHPVVSDNGWSRLWWLTPQGWWLAVSEIAGIAVFYAGIYR